MSEGRVAAESVTKRFGPVEAVAGVTLDVVPGEILALLGPSGCGKTTFLRLVAGFERPDSGSIRLAGATVAGPGVFVPPERRRIGMVFQDYALFPHLSVSANVGFGMVRPRRLGRTVLPQAEIDRLLDFVGLAGLGDRLPHELSGGQQQRVALARALAPGPAVVLLDEPFSNLDAALRASVREEVRSILRAAGATAVFVTHDQEEALSLADRVAVMRAGHLCQVDTPDRLYARPADPFVATFVGDADVLPGHSDGERIDTVIGALPAEDGAPKGDVSVILRPEAIRLRLDGAGRGAVRKLTYFGHDQLIEVALPDGSAIRCRMGPGRTFEPGDRVAISVTGDVVAFPAGGEIPDPAPALANL